MLKHVKAIAMTLLIVAVIVTATVIIHESGHFAAGTLLGCKDVQVTLFDEHLETYTKMSCGSIGQVKFDAIALGGLMFILPISLVLFLLNKKNYSMIIFGFNLVISSSDYTYFLPSAAVYASIIAGALTVIYGESLLVDRYTKYLGAIGSYSQNQ